MRRWCGVGKTEFSAKRGQQVVHAACIGAWPLHGGGDEHIHADGRTVREIPRPRDGVMHGGGGHASNPEHPKGTCTRNGPDQLGCGWPASHAGKQDGMPDAEKPCEARGEDGHGGRVPDAYARRRPGPGAGGTGSSPSATRRAIHPASRRRWSSSSQCSATCRRREMVSSPVASALLRPVRRAIQPIRRSASSSLIVSEATRMMSSTGSPTWAL